MAQRYDSGLTLSYAVSKTITALLVRTQLVDLFFCTFVSFCTSLSHFNQIIMIETQRQRAPRLYFFSTSTTRFRVTMLLSRLGCMCVSFLTCSIAMFTDQNNRATTHSHLVVERLALAMSQHAQDGPRLLAARTVAETLSLSLLPSTANTHKHFHVVSSPGSL